MPPRTSQDALKQLQSFKKTRRDPREFLSEAQQELGVGRARENVSGLRSQLASTQELLRNIEPAVTGRTAGSLTTEGQRSSLVAREQRPVAETLGSVQSALGVESSNLADLVGQAQTKAQLGLEGQTSELNLLQDVYDRLFQQESEAQRRREAERLFKEQQRQFNEQLRQQRAAAASQASALGGLLGGGGKETTPTLTPEEKAIAADEKARQEARTYAQRVANSTMSTSAKLRVLNNLSRRGTVDNAARYRAIELRKLLGRNRGGSRRMPSIPEQASQTAGGLGGLLSRGLKTVFGGIF